jgi:hypothetical protein
MPVGVKKRKPRSGDYDRAPNGAGELRWRAGSEPGPPPPRPRSRDRYFERGVVVVGDLRAGRTSERDLPHPTPHPAGPTTSPLPGSGRPRAARSPGNFEKGLGVGEPQGRGRLVAQTSLKSLSSFSPRRGFGVPLAPDVPSPPLVVGFLVLLPGREGNFVAFFFFK